jgi:hypothetical protein
MLIQGHDVDRLTHRTPACAAGYNPLNLPIRQGDLSDRATRTEYIHNIHGTWRAVTRNDYLFGDL